MRYDGLEVKRPDAEAVSRDAFLLNPHDTTIASIEMGRTIARHQGGYACVIPVINRAVDRNAAPFAKLRALRREAKAVASGKTQTKHEPISPAASTARQGPQETPTTILKPRQRDVRSRHWQGLGNPPSPIRRQGHPRTAPLLCPSCCVLSILAKVSRKVAVRLKMSLSGATSPVSTQK
jgi:hypothetical protein